MTDQTPSMCFSGNPLDRAGNFRGDPAWLAEKYQSDDALFIPLWQLQPLLLPPIAAGDSRDVGWLPRSALASLLTPDRLCIFLGLNRRDKPLFAIDISEMADPENRSSRPSCQRASDASSCSASIVTFEMRCLDQSIISPFVSACMEW